jgi:hypothetical protein
MKMSRGAGEQRGRGAGEQRSRGGKNRSFFLLLPVKMSQSMNLAIALLITAKI